ncbi:AAA-like domain-containing protein [Fischerella sp. PCC 9605]|uniref:AAA-like domain-containing protein n=1 Tax=Fischerella sp. PCC 9605 TaxID=1173024 RepID=UPI0004AD0AC2|nr:AAA-like domain-containing protein [Fischerella sp. PCC 9605]
MKRCRGFVLSFVGLQKLQAKLSQFETEKGYKWTQQAISRQTQLVEPQGLHPTTIKKIVYSQIGVDERSLQILFQALGLELEPQDYSLAAHLDSEIELADSTDSAKSAEVQTTLVPEFPGGPVPLHSPFYIERTALQARACTEMTQSGGLVRIKAPQKMGKSSFALRLLDHTISLGYRTVRVDFQQAEESIFSDIDRFLRWFCKTLSYQLDVLPTLDKYWDEEAGSKVSCTIYLQRALLKPIQVPVVLLLNEINCVFEHAAISGEFLPLLRSWYEEAKGNSILQKLRLVLIYSTEIYVPLNFNQSPFNIGLPIELPDLMPEEIQTLATYYGLSPKVASPLMEMVGGHPYLVQLALYHLWNDQLTLEQLLHQAPTPVGIYANCLNRCLLMLQNNLELAEAFALVVEAGDKVCLSSIIAYKLESLGLIKLDNHGAKPSCKLYQQFFTLQSTIAPKAATQTQTRKSQLGRSPHASLWVMG